MRAQRNALLCLAAVATLALASADAAFAQKAYSRGASPNIGASRPIGPRGGDGGGGGYRGGGWGAAVPGVMVAIPQTVPPRGGQFIDDGTIDGVPQGRRRPPQRATNRTQSGAPPANESRLVPDEVVIEVSNAVSPQQINALQRRHRLTRVESRTFQLSGSTMLRWRIPDRRSVATVVRALEGEAIVASAQPNYLFRLQQSDSKDEPKPTSEGDPAQYELAKLRLPQAHALAKGGNVLVAVIDSAVDVSHPELTGAVAQTFDAIETPITPHKHGTAIAGLIAAHGRLMGAAPRARILAIRAFDPAGVSAEGSTFNILKGLDWAVANGARVINMSFAGPADPAVHRSLEAAHKKGVVLVAAAGNAGAKSPPLYPAADANVIAVTATDADDKLFEQSNRGRHIAVAAPGAQILLAIPDGSYEVASGTSYSAAEVSGIVALMLERKGNLTPDKVRGILLATTKDLGPKGHDSMFGAGLVDAYAAIMAEAPPVAAAPPRPVEHVSTGAR
jgi:hypothetical protein